MYSAMGSPQYRGGGPPLPHGSLPKMTRVADPQARRRQVTSPDASCPLIMSALPSMINPRLSLHCLTDGTTTQARNDRGSLHSENDQAPQPSGAIVCPHCRMLYCGHLQQWQDAMDCRAVSSHPT